MKIKYKLIEDPVIVHSDDYRELKNDKFKQAENLIVDWLQAFGMGNYHVDAITFLPEANNIVIGVYNVKNTDEGPVYSESEMVIIEDLEEDPIAYVMDHRDDIYETFELSENFVNLLKGWYSMHLEQHQII